jgi:hypothetical protein
MAQEHIWQILDEELDRWNQAGRIATLWLRDDDAVEPTARLDRLLGLTGTFSIPAVLAVIPARTGDALADRLATEPYISVAVHGWSHENHAPAGEKKQELGPHRSRRIILAELATALERMQQLHGQRLVPMLVPPWNRIYAGLLPDLAALGFEALSVYGPARAFCSQTESSDVAQTRLKNQAEQRRRVRQNARCSSPSPIRMLNSTIDLMDWHGTGGCHDHSLLVRSIVAQLRQAFDHGGDGIGLLTHHLVHDEAAWAFLERLFEMTARHAACKWRSAGDIMAGSAA